MQEIDIALLLQEEATQNQYIFNFVLMNLIFVVAYVNRKKKVPEFITWLLLIVFVLYAYWDTDYFSFRYNFYTSLEGFRDPLYYYLSLLSFKSYTIFRLLIWGTALLLFYKTSRRFNLPSNYTAFIFAIFFLLTFSYARVSLGMALYFYGLSLILRPIRGKELNNLLWGIIIIASSYFGHRSMSVLILLTPLIFIKLNRKTLFLMVLAGIAFSSIAGILLSGFADESISVDPQFNAISDAANQYAVKDIVVEYNWKFTLIRNLRNYSIIIMLLYIVWKAVFTNAKVAMPNSIKRLIYLCCGILIIAVSFMSIPGLGAEIIGYRFLYMLGIPLCIIFTYMCNQGITKPKIAIILLIPALLYAEGFIFGKILSF